MSDVNRLLAHVAAVILPTRRQGDMPYIPDRLNPLSVTLVTKADIVEAVAAGTGLTKVETEAVVNGFLTTVKASLVGGEPVFLRGFGTFRVQRRAPRTARNPRTNQEVKLGERVIPVFKPAPDFKASVEESLDPSEV
jgi:DNA-binding protein HU-beta